MFKIWNSHWLALQHWVRIFFQLKIVQISRAWGRVKYKMRIKDSFRTTTETNILFKFSFNSTDPASTQYPQGGKINIGDLPVFYVATNFIVQNISSLNGPIRQIPMTQNNHRPIPSLSDEPLWMKRSTICPVQEGKGASSSSFMAIKFGTSQIYWK